MPSPAEPERKSKILLLTGTPPGIRGVGEVILRDLALHHGAENIRCAAVVPPGYVWRPDPRLKDLQVQELPSEFLHAKRWGKGRFSALGPLWNYITGFGREVRRLTNAIVREARQARIDQVVAVLNYPLMPALAQRIARELGRPLICIVWDSPAYLLRQEGFDRFSRARLVKAFGQALAYSQRVAVISETMREDYAALTNAEFHILRYGLPLTTASETAPLPEQEWVIGFAGSMYADCAWQALLTALDGVNWQVAGRPVKLKLWTSSIYLASGPHSSIEFLGYPSVEATQIALQRCHLTYLPQPFAEHFGDFSRYSFPTKLSSYLAVGRPVFAHCPANSALARFFQAHPIGALSTSMEPATIIAALEDLLRDPGAYRSASAAAQQVAREQFGEAIFFKTIDRLFRPCNA